MSEDIKTFVPTCLVMQKNSLVRKVNVNFKFMTSQPGIQASTMHILPNISRNKDYQTIKFGKLIEYNIYKKRFCSKIIHRCGGESSSRPFFKKSKFSRSMDQQSKVLYRLFLLYV